MKKQQTILKKLSDKVHSRTDDAPLREALAGVIKQAQTADEAKELRDILTTRAFEIAAGIKPKYCKKKLKDKAVGGMTEGSFIGALAALLSLIVSEKLGIQDIEARAFLTVSISSIVTGAVVSIKRAYFNWQKHKYNR